MILEAYTEGINAYLTLVQDQTSTLLSLPPEFLIVGLRRVSQWSPVDSLAILRL